MSVWTDEEIEVGTASWVRAIDVAIRETGCLVVILSPEAATSQWVGEELQFARIQNKRAFPILVRGAEKDSIPFGLAGAQWIDIRVEDEYDVKLTEFIDAIRQYLQIEASSPTQMSRQEQRQATQITQQIYQQLRDYRAKILGFQIDDAAKNRDALAAHIATLEAERDLRIMEIDFELNDANISPTRKYFLNWLHIHENFWHKYRLAVGYRDALAAFDAKNEAIKQISQAYREFLSSGEMLDANELFTYIYLEALKYARSSTQISLDSLKWRILVDERWSGYLMSKLEMDGIIQNLHDADGTYQVV